jgi:hypothetical protein
MECVTVCPADGALQFSLPKNRRIQGWAMSVAIGVILIALIGFAQWKGFWKSDIPDSTYERLIPKLDQLMHP